MVKALLFTAVISFVTSVGLAGELVRMKNQTLHLSAVPMVTGGGTSAVGPRFIPSFGRVYYIVQFEGPVRAEWKKILKNGGVELSSYLPDDAFLVRINSPASWKALNGLHSVRAVTPYKSDLRVSQDFQPLMTHDGDSKTKVIVKLAFADEANNVIRVASQRGLNFVLDEASDKVLALEIPLNQIQKLADIEGVEWVEPLPEIQSMDFDVFNGDSNIDGSTTPPPVPIPGASPAPTPPPNVSPIGDYTDLTGYESGTKIMNFDAAYAKGLHGEGEVVGIADTGLDRGSLTDLLDDFKTSLVKGYMLGLFAKSWEDPQGHGTHTSGSIAGSGALSGGKLHGGAYGARLVMQSLWSPMIKNLTIVPDFDRIFGQVRRDDDVHIHSNSWGSPKVVGVYDSFAAQVDQLSWNYPDLLIVFAAGNAGVDDDKDGRIDANSISAPATAKNCLTVGASKNYLMAGGIQRPMKDLRDGNKHWAAEPIASSRLSDNPMGMAAFSSRGPTMDGRIKPEIVAPGTNIVSTRSQQANATALWGGYNNSYAYAGGTSMATPLTAGAAAVIRQNLRLSGFSDPSAALVKALIIHTATDLFPGQFPLGTTQEFLTKRPNNDEGFGRVDVDAGTSLAKLALVDDPTGLRTGEVKEYSMDVDSGQTVKATMVYTDAPAAASAAKALVNDLDLAVVDNQGGIHYPNHMKGPDRTNNTEMVEFTAPSGGQYKVVITAHSVPQGRDGTSAQPYALVMK